MPQFQPSVWIFVVFALLALAALAGIGFFIADRLQPVIMNALRSNDRLPSLQSRRRGARRRQEDDEPADDLDDSTQLVLSMLSLASVVVDDQDEVVRANPAAYRLGLVRDDTLIEPTLLDAVHKVMKDGSRCSFDLETQTPEQFMTMNGFDAAAADDGLTAEASSRPNWLKVTVGRIGDHLVLVLINDVSESIRFAQIRDSFISNVSEQLLQPTRALERLADSLESADVSHEQLSNHARQVRHSCVRLDRMISDLLMLIKAQEPVTASEANRCDLFSQVSGAVDDLAGTARDAGVQVRVGGKSPVMIHGRPIRFAWPCARWWRMRSCIHTQAGRSASPSPCLRTGRTPWCVSSIMARACRRPICPVSSNGSTAVPTRTSARPTASVWDWRSSSMRRSPITAM